MSIEPKKSLKEEKTVIDLELAVKKEEFKKKRRSEEEIMKEEKTVIDLGMAVKKEEFSKMKKKSSHAKIEM